MSEAIYGCGIPATRSEVKAAVEVQERINRRMDSLETLDKLLGRITLDSHCKFCNKPITLTVPELKQSLHKLIVSLVPMVACNRCADLRVENRRLFGKVRSAASWWSTCRSPSDDEKTKARNLFTKLTRDYEMFIRKWEGKDTACWDEGVVAALMKCPSEYGKILKDMWAAFRQATAQGSLGV